MVPTSPRSDRPARRSRAAAPRGEARRGRIVEAALCVISRVGPDGLTHRLVAAEAGVPLAATTYWFSSKEELIREAFEESAPRDAARFARQRAAVAAWAPDQVADRLAETVLELLTEERESTVVDYSLWVEAARRPGLRAVADRWSATCRDFYAAALERAGVAEPERDAHVVSAAV